MHSLRFVAVHHWVRTHQVHVHRTLVVTTSLIVGASVCLSLGLALVAGSAPVLDQQIRLGTHHLVIHIGASPTCGVIPNPPQHDCISPGPTRRELSVADLTPQGIRSLLWLQLPPR